MANGNLVKGIWEGYNPKEDKDQVIFRTKQVDSNIIIGEALKDGNNKMNGLDTRLAVVEAYCENTEAAHDAKQSLLRKLGVIVVESVAIAGVVGPFIYIAIKAAF